VIKPGDELDRYIIYSKNPKANVPVRVIAIQRRDFVSKMLVFTLHTLLKYKPSTKGAAITIEATTLITVIIDDKEMRPGFFKGVDNAHPSMMSHGCFFDSIAMLIRNINK
jgi:hypothetical protein